MAVIFNRDERYARPAKEMHFWPEPSQIVAGRDLKRGGTWSGVTRDGRFACLTSEVVSGRRGLSPRSRGLLVSDYLDSSVSADKYINDVLNDIDHYSGFNLVVGHRFGLLHLSTLSRKVTEVGKGVSGLSNADLNTDWPKVTVGKMILEGILSRKELDPSEAMALMTNKGFFGTTVDNWDYSDRIFIEDGDYGTRATSFIRFFNEKIVLNEWQHAPGKVSVRSTRFTLEC